MPPLLALWTPEDLGEQQNYHKTFFALLYLFSLFETPTAAPSILYSNFNLMCGKILLLISLRTSEVAEEVPLKSHHSHDLEVADGVNLDSDTETTPRIRTRNHSDQASLGGGSRRSRPSSVSSAKLKYQSEIRNLIRSHQELDNNNITDSDSDYERNYQENHFSTSVATPSGRNSYNKVSSTVRYDNYNSNTDDDYDNEEPRYVDHDHMKVRQSQQHSHRSGYEEYNNTENRMEDYRLKNNIDRQNVKSVIFGSNSINKKIHDEFRLRAKRNESFKIAISSPKLNRRGSMKDSLKRSMEDLHDGFVSLSGKSSRTASIRGRSGSISSLRSVEHAQTLSVDEDTDRRYSSSESETNHLPPPPRQYKSQDHLTRDMKQDMMTKSAVTFEKLSRGLGPRRAPRERVNTKQRNRSASRDNLGG